MAYAFVQTKSASGSGVTSVTTPAFSSNTTVGNQLIASTSAATFPGLAFTSTVTDSKSNTWRNDASQSFTNTSGVKCLANIDQTILTTAGSGHTVTFTSNDAGNTYYEVACTEFSGATSTIDQTAANTVAGASTSLTATTSATTNANDLLICVFGANGLLSSNGQNSPANVNGSQTGVLSIYDVADDTDITGIESSYKILSATGTQAVNYTYTSDTSGAFGLVVVVYKAAVAGAVDNTTARTIASPGLKLGTPISRLRSPVLDTGSAPQQSINQTVGVPSRALRLGTPVSRLRSSNLFDDRSTPAPPVVPVDAGAKPGWAIALKLGTPVALLRSGYDQGSSAASPNVTLALTGQQISSAHGAITAKLSYALTGQAITSSEGALGRNLSSALSGQKITSAEGTLSYKLTYGLTGQKATFTEGTITASTGGNVTLSLGGQRITSAEGSLAAQISYGLTGHAITSSEGLSGRTLTYGLTGHQIVSGEGSPGLKATYALSGHAITSSEGAISSSTSQNVTVALTGLRAVFAQGTISISGADAVVPKETPAGRRTRPQRYIVRIDGQEFIFQDLKAALEFLDRARLAAAQLVKEADFPKLEPPRIVVNSRDLRKAASVAKREIAATYRDAALNAELAMLFEMQRIREDEESILLLL